MAELMLQNRKIEPPYLLQRFGVSVAEFEEITDEDLKAELMDGVMIVHSPATLRHDDLLGFLLFLVRGYAESQQWGKVLGPNAIMQLGERRRFAPDLMFIRRERLRLPLAKQFQGAADWVIEILSEHTRSYDLREKRTIYQEAGIAEIWFIDGEEQRVIADRRRGGGYEETVISTGRVNAEVLPGFWLDAAWLWLDQLPNPLASLEQILKSNQ
ncbi:MAG: Uma2 family endonuclease [Candidatus Bipolaricaulota bacterium]|nr:Uma2 family endonuclease [Candidatus Bipolaricaulota bacterium]MCS7274523.1 Uma2 family endonuclease [Candidatus Bipolaricaulota bacterium]MDW8111080.1 Uma2 family endonuclease [Candidatus Bipolaricaulota bacterium]MDW8329090.1 Uma2 family endonuclease [Candidatus Bipolaricaulota bacterium]